MTIKFKNSLKSVPGGWVTFEPVSPLSEELKQLYQGIKNLPLKNPCSSIIDDYFHILDENPEEPSMHIYSLVVLTTEQVETPIWSIWDQFITNRTTDFLETYNEHKKTLEERLEIKNITGYKLISTQMSVEGDSGNIKFLADYCTTKFNPKSKVYINGPKKSNEFLTKKAKQYANANNF